MFEELILFLLVIFYLISFKLYSKTSNYSSHYFDIEVNSIPDAHQLDYSSSGLGLNEL